MRTGFRVLVVAVSIVVLSGLATSLVAPGGERSDAPPAMVPVPSSSGISPKFHIAETFTGVWCGPCGTADPGISRVQDEWKNNLLLIAWHCCSTSPNYDPYYDPAVTGIRDGFYNWQYLPTVVIDGGGSYTDGTLWYIGSGGTSGGAYDQYRLRIEDSTDSSSNVAVSIVGDLTPTTASATVSITATDPVPQTNLFLRTVVFEDALYYPQNAGLPYHRNTARALNEQPFIISQGQTVTLSASFSLNPSWNVNNLGIVALVQSSNKVTINIPSYGTYYNSDILNAAWTRFVPTGIMVYRDRGTTADYTEAYEVALARMGEDFDAWNTHVLGTDTGATDDRGIPDATALEETSLLIWHTGPTSTNVLTATDRSTIGGFLDGHGSVLVTGSSIGFDAWTTYRTWYQQYLHAAYENDDTGFTYVRGVAGDPISDTFSGTNLNVLASPDQINLAAPGPGTAVPFVYGTGTTPGSVRAQHDTDSRVVYLGFQYFENTVDANRFLVMQKIVNYTDGASPPRVDVLYPDGGEQIDPGANVEVRWLATDVRFPANAVDIFFNSNYPSGVWTPIAQNQPNDGLYKWTLPSVNSGSCRIRVVARDTSPESADGTGESASDFICGNPYFEITFGPADEVGRSA